MAETISKKSFEGGKYKYKYKYIYTPQEHLHAYLAEEFQKKLAFSASRMWLGEKLYDSFFVGLVFVGLVFQW